MSAVPLYGVTKKRAEFLSLGIGKSGFLYWKFLIVVNPHFPDATPTMGFIKSCTFSRRYF
ncbi:hypothetical protein FT640_24200 [Bacillus paranthracis]|nr:hypothetical protein [Bacillus paranthracis]